MNAYESNTTLDAVADRIRAADRIALFTHAKPDGDAIGSLLGLRRGLEQVGKAATAWVMGPLEPNVLSLAEDTPLHRIEDGAPDNKSACGPGGGEPDLIVIVDTGSWAQLDPVADWLAARTDRVVCIDHHGQGDPDVAAHRVVDVNVPAATVLVTRLLDALGVELTGGPSGIAEPLFLGLATDTGWFRHGVAEVETFRLAARLLECGVDKTRLYQLVEETHRPQRLAMLAQALKSLEYLNNGEVAVMSLAPEDFSLTGGVLEELTGMVNEPLSVDTVRLSVLLTQTEPGRTKMSFRSKPAANGSAASPSGTPTASELAARFGGGGHTHAAGARVDLDVEPARHAVREALRDSASPRVDTARHAQLPDPSSEASDESASGSSGVSSGSSSGSTSGG